MEINYGYKQYRDGLKEDALAMELNPKAKLEMFKAHFANPRWRFIKKLRRAEYYKSKRKNLFNKVLYLYNWYDYKKLGVKLGFSIPVNVIQQGLSLPHYGTIVISEQAKIGKNARIHVCVNIGVTDEGTPAIGNNFYIGTGVKIFGPVKIGNNVKIGANAVVNKSFNEDNIVIAGVPAKIVKRLI